MWQIRVCRRHAVRKGGEIMKRIYISLPISGHEDTYEQRLDDAVEYVKEMYPEYERIITQKEVAERLENYKPNKLKYKDYMLAYLKEIRHCDAIFMCQGWHDSSGCYAEWALAWAIGLTILYK